MSRRRLALAGALIALLGVTVLVAWVVGGRDDDGDAGVASPPTSLDGVDGVDGSDGTDARPADPGAVEIALEEVASFEQPIASALRPGSPADEIYVAERTGLVWLLHGSDKIGPLLDISDDTRPEGERGLLGLAIAPDGDRLYLSYTDSEGTSHLDEYSLTDDGTIDRESLRPVLQVAQPFANHNGGHIAFGPDGHLYIGLGDGGGAGDPQRNGQNPATLLGSILRIDPTPAPEAPYSVPDDNPFADGDDGAPEVFVYGLRNPWRFSFDAETDELWIADVGQNEREEITHLPAGEQAGANLGWNIFEGTSLFEGPPIEGTVPPVFDYGREQGQSITGGVVYRGSAIPDLDGAYLFADFYQGEIRAVTLGSEGDLDTERSLDVVVPSLVHFAETADGEVLAFSLDGPVFRLVPA